MTNIFKRTQLSNILILLFVFFLGYLTSNIEQRYWYGINERALLKQIDEQDCMEMTIPKWQEQRDAKEKRSYARLPKPRKP